MGNSVHLLLMIIASRLTLAPAFLQRAQIETLPSRLFKASELSRSFQRGDTRPRTKGVIAKGKSGEMGDSKFYNDDAFGLILASGGIAAHDEVFTIAFIFLSAVAATATFNDKLPADSRVPSAVAALTFLASQVTTQFVGYNPLNLAGLLNMPLREVSKSAIFIEAAVCAVSIAWGYAQSRTEGEKYAHKSTAATENACPPLQSLKRSLKYYGISKSEYEKALFC